MTTAVSGHELALALRQRFPEAVVSADNTSVQVLSGWLSEIGTYLRDDPDQAYALLSSITAVDYIEYFELVYHLTSVASNRSAVLKAHCYGRDLPTVRSVVPVWKGAELQEREIYDLMGICFHGHPDLKRVLLWEGFQGFPLRRDYLEPPLPYTWPHGG